MMQHAFDPDAGPKKGIDALTKALDGEDSYGEDMDEVAELDAKANFSGLREEQIVNPNRRISSVVRLNTHK